jgi:hypothetical protein
METEIRDLTAGPFSVKKDVEDLRVQTVLIHEDRSLTSLLADPNFSRPTFPMQTTTLPTVVDTVNQKSQHWVLASLVPTTEQTEENRVSDLSKSSVSESRTPLHLRKHMERLPCDDLHHSQVSDGDDHRRWSTLDTPIVMITWISSNDISLGQTPLRQVRRI